MRDAEYYLNLAAREAGKEVTFVPRLAEDLLTVLRVEGQQAFERRLGEEVTALDPEVDVVLLSQFSFASALDHLRGVSTTPVLSAPHSSARGAQAYVGKIRYAGPRRRIHQEAIRRITAQCRWYRQSPRPAQASVPRTNVGNIRRKASDRRPVITPNTIRRENGQITGTRFCDSNNSPSLATSMSLKGRSKECAATMNA